MHGAALLAVLETANRHIAEGERRIEHQRDILTRLEERGRGASHTATIAREVLASMERVQRAHLSHRDQVKAELARLDDFARSPLLSSINASTGAERGRDANTGVQERS